MMNFSVTELCTIQSIHWCNQFNMHYSIRPNITAEAIINVRSGEHFRSIHFSGQSLCSLEQRKISFLTPQSTISGYLYDAFSGKIVQHYVPEKGITVPLNCIAINNDSWWINGNQSQYPIGVYFNGKNDLIHTSHPFSEWRNVLFIGDSMSRTLFQGAINVVSDHDNYYHGIEKGWCVHDVTKIDPNLNWTEFKVGSSGVLRRIGSQDGCWHGGMAYHYCANDPLRATTFLYYNRFANVNYDPGHFKPLLEAYSPNEFTPQQIVFANGLHGIYSEAGAGANTARETLMFLRQTYPNAKITVLGNWVHNLQKKDEKWAYLSLPSVNMAYSLELTRNLSFIDRFMDMTECTAPFYNDNIDGVHFKHEAVNFMIRFLWTSMKYHPCNTLGFNNKM